MKKKTTTIKKSKSTDKSKNKNRYIEGIGRRKEATARVRIYPSTTKALKDITEKEKKDITLIDPKKRWRVESKTFHSMGANTPFEGKQLQGKAVMTIVGGSIAYREN